MTIETEFPDYPVSDIPALPPGFVDYSWHNDTMPHWVNEALGLAIWIDYADPELREIQGEKRFWLYNVYSDGQQANRPLVETDDWPQIVGWCDLRAMARKKDELRNEIQSSGGC